MEDKGNENSGISVIMSGSILQVCMQRVPGSRACWKKIVSLVPENAKKTVERIVGTVVFLQDAEPECFFGGLFLSRWRLSAAVFAARETCRLFD